MKLVLIHGRAQARKDPAQLQQEWENAFKIGLQTAGLSWPAGLSVSFPFYGDALDDLVNQINAPLVTEVVTKGASQDESEASFRGELIYEIASNSGVSDAEIQAQFAGEAHEKGPLNWGWVQAILQALDKTPLGGTAIDKFTRDVYVYLNYRAVRKAIDSIVSDHISSPCVVVGHSLGSVVGYNVLGHTPASVNVRRYITLGSPLGLRAIKRKLDTPLAMPPCARGWYNAMDERDVVALYPLDSAHFPIDPAIENKTDVDNFTDNRHGIAGYLNDPDVARKIHEAVVAPI
jgi:hypothetical protein